MEFFNWLFFGPAKLIAIWEYSGVAVGAVLIIVQAVLMLRARQTFDIGFFRTAPVFAGLLWWIFTAYELQTTAVAATEALGTALRIDLMVLVPILYVLTLAALATILQALRSPKASSKADSKQ